jgi:hypothetical protein
MSSLILQMVRSSPPFNPKTSARRDGVRFPKWDTLGPARHRHVPDRRWRLGEWLMSWVGQGPEPLAIGG